MGLRRPCFWGRRLLLGWRFAFTIWMRAGWRQLSCKRPRRSLRASSRRCSNIRRKLRSKHRRRAGRHQVSSLKCLHDIGTPSGTGAQTPTGSFTGQLPTTSSVNPLLQAATTASLGVPQGGNAPPSNSGEPGGPSHHFHSQTPTNIKMAKVFQDSRKVASRKAASPKTARPPLASLMDRAAEPETRPSPPQLPSLS